MPPDNDTSDFGSIKWPADLGRTVAPIFREVSPGLFTFCGSAVLLAGPKGSHWLVSAAHVLAEFEHAQLAVTVDGLNFWFVAVKGMVVSTCELTLTNAANDRKDLAFVQLHPATVRELERDFHFLPLTKVDQVRPTSIPTPCILAGYPEAFATIEEGRPVKVIELRSKSILLPRSEVSRRIGLDPSIHLVAPFQQMKDEAGHTIPAPDPAGMSGGAVWTASQEDLSLAGIIIEYDERRGEVVATRVGPLAAEIGRRVARDDFES